MSLFSKEWYSIKGSQEHLNEIFYSVYEHYKKLQVQNALWSLEIAYRTVKKNKGCSFIINNKEKLINLNKSIFCTQTNIKLFDITLIRRNGTNNSKPDDLKIFSDAVNSFPICYAHLLFDFENINELDDRFAIYKKIIKATDIEECFFDYLISFKRVPTEKINIFDNELPKFINNNNVDLMNLHFPFFIYGYLSRSLIDFNKKIILFMTDNKIKSVQINVKNENEKRRRFLQKGVNPDINIEFFDPNIKKDLSNEIKELTTDLVFTLFYDKVLFSYEKNKGIKVSELSTHICGIGDFMGVNDFMSFEIPLLIKEITEYSKMLFQQMTLGEIIQENTICNKTKKRI